VRDPARGSPQTPCPPVDGRATTLRARPPTPDSGTHPTPDQPPSYVANSSQVRGLFSTPMDGLDLFIALFAQRIFPSFHNPAQYVNKRLFSRTLKTEAHGRGDCRVHLPKEDFE